MGDRSKTVNLWVGKKILELRTEKGLTQLDVAKKVNKGDSTVRMWELGRSEPDNETLIILADFFGVSVDYLLGRSDKRPATAQLSSYADHIPIEDLEMYPIPLLGEVVAGIPIEAQQNLEGYIYISFRPKEEYFALRVHGDSMKDAGIFDRSIVICHKQETAENGDVVVAMLNGEETVKRYKVHGNSVFLMPANSDFMPIPVTPEDEFMILGKVVESRMSH